MIKQEINITVDGIDFIVKPNGLIAREKLTYAGTFNNFIFFEEIDRPRQSAGFVHFEINNYPYKAALEKYRKLLVFV